MNIDEAVARACMEPTLDDAISWIAVWENERVIAQVREFDKTGVSTAAQGNWDTCFATCFKRVREHWRSRVDVDALIRKALEGRRMGDPPTVEELRRAGRHGAEMSLRVLADVVRDERVTAFEVSWDGDINIEAKVQVPAELNFITLEVTV